MTTTRASSSTDSTPQAQAPAPDAVPRFEFGQNWSAFVRQHFSEERAAISKAHLLRFLNVDNLAGKRFIDIGCGSGLHSMAALDAGAAEIVSFDLDPNSVAATRQLRAMRGDPAHWQILQGSVLDEHFLASIKPGDIAYSWGVLHHTGAMWQAIRNASRLMAEDGLFYIALYQTTKKSAHWIRVKKKYQQASPAAQKRMVQYRVFRKMIWPSLKRLQDPRKKLREYEKSRGMEYVTDVRDWLGGWPYEDARPDEVVRFGRDLNLALINLDTTEGNAEYLFKRR